MFARARLNTACTLFILLAIAFSSIAMAPAVYGQRTDRDAKNDLFGRGWGFTDAETCLMKHINWIRKRKGLRALTWDRQLGYVARRHARGMASTGAVYHDNNMGQEITRWRRLGQNTGRAGGCKKAFWAFMHSGSHRANILGSWKHVAVGAERRHGRLWVQQVFESYNDPGNVYHYP